VQISFPLTYPNYIVMLSVCEDAVAVHVNVGAFTLPVVYCVDLYGIL